MEAGFSDFLDEMERREGEDREKEPGGNVGGLEWP